MFSTVFFCCFYFDYWFMINAMILLKRYLLHYSFGTKVHNSITFHFTPSWSHIDLSVGVLTCFAGTFPFVINCTRQLTSPWAIVIGSEHYVLGECQNCVVLYWMEFVPKNHHLQQALIWSSPLRLHIFSLLFFLFCVRRDNLQKSVVCYGTRGRLCYLQRWIFCVSVSGKWVWSI
jgi:hypothetical protein